MKDDTKRPTSCVTPFNLEIDKVADAWVLTHWVGSGVAATEAQSKVRKG